MLNARFQATPSTAYIAARSLGAGPIRAAARWLGAEQQSTLLLTIGAAMLTSMSEVTITLFVTDTRVLTIARKAMSGISLDVDPSGFAAFGGWLAILAGVYVAVESSYWKGTNNK
jgi:ABC-type spermidine/putrescine transport system permease subunit II